MFGQKNKNTTSSSGSAKPTIDPKNLRTLVGPDPSQVNRSSDMDFRRKSEPERRDFRAGEELVGGKVAMPTPPEPVPTSSPFFGEEIQKDTQGAQTQEVTDARLSQEQSETSTPEVGLPKEDMKQKMSFHPLNGSSGRNVSEDALSSHLSVGNYTGRDGAGVARANTIKKEKTRGVLIRVVLVVFIVALAGLALWGGYYYWSQRVVPVQESVSAPEVVIVNETQSETTVPQETKAPYEAKIVNTIIVDDTQGKTVESEMKKVESTLAQYEGAGVFEFFFVDANTNFETLTAKNVLERLSIGLPENIATLVSESGEGRVYFSKKEGFVRLALAIPMNNRDSALAGALSAEAILPKTFAPLYLGNIDVSDAPATFRDQSYREYALRYHNVNFDQNYSFDYTFRRDTLMVGTSKDGLRDALDFLDGKNSVAQNDEMEK